MIAAVWRKGPFGNRVAAGVLAGVAALVVAMAGLGSWIGLSRVVPDHLESDREAARERGEVWRWLAERTPPQAGVLAFNGGALYLRAGRRYYALRAPTSYYYRDDSDGLLRWLREAPRHARQSGLSFVVLGDGDYWNDLSPELNRSLRASLDRDPRLQTVYSAGRYRVYRIALH
ncbi:MAG TPA: hypothetical protein DEH78_01080 [Solibacterales bacterium]|nr:hypothetical protein [Bryobacterales bacterium]